MANRVNKVDNSPNTNRTLQEEEIKELFETLHLGTAADREKFLWLARLSNDPNPGQDRTNEPLRVRFGDSTASTPPWK